MFANGRNSSFFKINIKLENKILKKLLKYIFLNWKSEQYLKKKKINWRFGKLEN